MSFITIATPNCVIKTILRLSIMVEFIPKIHISLTITNPEVATLGDKKQCIPMVVS